ncbi:hypothetical protein KEJ18_04090 [Candidatus Bathyarchaeota archaeon]|nr:hypothetical protein [Candidatus Bathyarchaeota archaeon]
MAVTAFDILGILERSGVFTSTTIDGKPFKIRIGFENKVNYSTKKRAIKILKEMGFQQIGNTPSWILTPKARKNAETN